jgi:hypothetical protein
MMADRDDEPSVRFATALRTMLTRRGIPESAEAVSAHLRTRDVHIHPNTIRQYLKGRRFPRPTTREKLFRGLDVEEDEREEALGFGILWSTDTDLVPQTSRLLDEGIIDRGRVMERVSYTYVVGRTSDGDGVIETRRTFAGRDGLEVAKIGPGQMGRPSFDVRRIEDLELKVAARVSDPSPRAVKATASLARIRTRGDGCDLLVSFGEKLRRRWVDWTVSYRWPGLWDPLRAERRDVGQVNFRPDGTEVDLLTVRVPVPRELSETPSLRPRDGHLGTVERGPYEDGTVLTWMVERPPTHACFEVAL